MAEKQQTKINTARFFAKGPTPKVKHEDFFGEGSASKSTASSAPTPVVSAPKRFRDDTESKSRARPATESEPSTRGRSPTVVMKDENSDDELYEPIVHDTDEDTSAMKKTIMKSRTPSLSPEPRTGRAESKTSSSRSKTPSSRSPVGRGAKMSKSSTESFIDSLKGFSLQSAVSWKRGEPTPFAALVQAFDEIEQNTGRLRITEIIRDLYRKVIALTPEDLLPAVYLSTGQCAPSYEGIELGISEKSLEPLVADLIGTDNATLKKHMKDTGDLGKVAQEKRKHQSVLSSSKPLTISGIYNELRKVADEQGSSAMQRKQDRIKKLLAASRDSEIRYLIRIVSGKLRIGLAEPSVLAALGHAFTLTPDQDNYDTSKTVPGSQLAQDAESAAQIVKQVFSEVPSYDEIIKYLLAGGINHLRDSCSFTPGVPVKSMLAKPTKGLQEVLDRFSGIPFTCEFKYDGERAQIHRQEDGRITIYSRNSENLTGKYPDVIKYIAKSAKPGTKSFVLDTEIVAINKTTKKIQSFQSLSRRARKDVKIENIEIDVCVYGFDCIYMNGKCLLSEPFKNRRNVLHSSFVERELDFRFAQSMDSADIEDIQEFLQDAIASSCEGLMVKTLERESTYEPSKRSNKWLKVKKDYLENLGDSFDLIPIGAFHGKGKRTGVYGAFLLACYDDDADCYQTVCKVGTGFSEIALEELHGSLKESKISSPLSNYIYSDTQGLVPDVWFAPDQVWEVLAADLSISPNHKAAMGLVERGKGIALRFPRFIRVRTDKKATDATGPSQIAEIYRSQAVVSQNAKPKAKSKGKDGGEDEDEIEDDD